MADTNVWVAAAIAPNGVCGRLLRAAIAERWQPIASPMLMDELAEVLARRKFRRWFTADDARRFGDALRAIVELAPDPSQVTVHTADPDDDYLMALAQSVEGVQALISGDPHLTDMTDVVPPVMTPAAFLALLER